jgi:hypothetical protein
LTKGSASGTILDGYRYVYNAAQMINITRNTKTVRFSYDNTYQLTWERGQYQTNSYGATAYSRAFTNRLECDAFGAPATP